MIPSFELIFRCNETDVFAYWRMSQKGTHDVTDTPYTRHLALHSAVHWEDPLPVLTMLKRRKAHVSDLLKAFQLHVWLCLILTNLIIALLIAFAERLKPFPLVYEKFINLLNQTCPITVPRNSCGYLLTAMGILLNYFMAVAFSNDFTSFFLTPYTRPVASKLCGHVAIDPVSIRKCVIGLLSGDAVYGLQESDLPHTIRDKVYRTYRYASDFNPIHLDIVNVLLISRDHFFPQICSGSTALLASLARRSRTAERTREHNLFSTRWFAVRFQKTYKPHWGQRRTMKKYAKEQKKAYSLLVNNGELLDETEMEFSLSNLQSIFLIVCYVLLLPVFVFISEFCLQGLNAVSRRADAPSWWKKLRNSKLASASICQLKSISLRLKKVKKFSQNHPMRAN
jgi:hypothetical protein